MWLASLILYVEYKIRDISEWEFGGQGKFSSTLITALLFTSLDCDSLVNGSLSKGTTRKNVAAVWSDCMHEANLCGLLQ